MIDIDRPVLFDCVVDQKENCFPMIPSGKAHNEMILGDSGVSLDDAIAEMINVRRPVIFDCRVAALANCFPMIPSGKAHTEMLLGEEVSAEAIQKAIGKEGKVLV
jgi:thiamine pyrophosphate-dependent acetolactate synthase large subunit-like protein